MLTRRPAALFAALVLAPAVLAAQPRRARPSDAPPAGRPERGASPTELLNRRRELDLTPRQVARLDSLERIMVSHRRSLMDQTRSLRDSACGTSGRCNLSDSARRSFGDRMAQFRGRGMDTTIGREAFAVLDSTQRGRVQGMRMSRAREEMARRRGAMGRQGNDFGPRQGPVRGRMDARPGRGRGAADDRWMPRGGGRFVPGWRGRGEDRRPRPPLPPVRRRGGDLDSLEHPDSTR